MNEILVLSTTDSMELAERVATALVDAGEAACVNIVPGVRSIYRWQGKVCDDSELLLVIKTSSGLFDAVCATIRRLHTYQVPEAIALPITAADLQYRAWLNEQLTPSGD